MMTTRQLIQEIRRHQPAELALLLGAGASKSSGVPLAWEMIAEWRMELFESRATEKERGQLTADAWLESNSASYTWLGGDAEYSKLFELCYRTPVRRQKYIEEKIEHGRPGWGYLYLANLIVQARRFTTVFTTNFDDLINEALSVFLHHNAVVCNADAEVDNISFLSDRAKIIKLHGDYLFLDIRNTEEELRALGVRMAEKFQELSRQRGLVVIGYAGRDQSVMSMIERLLEDPKGFPYSLYWGIRPGESPSARVEALAKSDARFQLFECTDFDSFMAGLHTELKLELPATILSPHSQLEAQLEPLVRLAEGTAKDSAIQAHAVMLRGQLGRPAEAELALSRRDYAAAIRLAERHLRDRGPSVAVLTVWGEALLVQSDEEGREDLFHEAERKLEDAIALDPNALPPRYALARLYSKRQLPEETIHAAEALERLAPNDHGVHRNLFLLYSQVQRLADAERELEWLAEHESASADLHGMKASLRHAQGRSGEAIDELTLAVGLMPENANLRFNLGQLLLSQQRLDEAETQLKAAVRLAPDNALCLITMAQLAVARQKPAEAIQYFERAARGNPSSVEVKGWLGDLYLQAGRPLDALREVEAALVLRPDDARIFGILGTIQMALNDVARAEEALLKARDLNPALAPPYWWLGLIYARQKRHVELNQAVQGLWRINPVAAQQLQVQAGQLQGPAQPWSHAQQAWQALQPPAPSGSPSVAAPPGRSQDPQGIWTKLFGG